MEATTQTTTSPSNSTQTDSSTLLKKKSRFAFSVDKYTILLIVSIIFFISSLSFWIYVQYML